MVTRLVGRLRGLPSRSHPITGTVVTSPDVLGRCGCSVHRLLGDGLARSRLELVVDTRLVGRPRGLPSRSHPITGTVVTSPPRSEALWLQRPSLTGGVASQQPSSSHGAGRADAGDRARAARKLSCRVVFNSCMLRVYYRTHGILSLLTIRELPDFAPRVTPGILPSPTNHVSSVCPDCKKS